MKKHFFQQITAGVLALVLTSGLLFGIFVPKVSAEPITASEALSKALGDGAACFLAALLESKAKGWIAKASAKIEGKADAFGSSAVPNAQENAAPETAKLQADSSLNKAKLCLRDAILKTLLDWLVDETVAWIQDDGRGRPHFVTNWDKFGEDAYNIGVGQFIYNTDFKWLCSPFYNQAKIALLTPPAPYKEQIQCTMKDIENNLENFWETYEASLQPQNNFYGAYYLTMLEMERQGQKSKEAAEKEASIGKGWLSTKECDPPLSDDEIEVLAADAWDAGYENNWEAYLQNQGYTYDLNKNWCLPKNSRIVTPGERIAKATDIIVEKDLSWAKSANVNAWTTSILNAVLDRFSKETMQWAREGLAKTKKSSDREFSPTPPLPSHLDTETPLKKEETERIKTDYGGIKQYVEEIIMDKEQSLSKAESIKTTLNEIKNKNCQPAVTDEELATAQKEIDRISGEIIFYKQMLTDTNSGIAESQTILNANQFKDEEIILLQKNYADFVKKYGATAVNPEAAKNASAEEKTKKQNDLDAAQIRLNSCLTTGETTGGATP